MSYSETISSMGLGGIPGLARSAHLLARGLDEAETKLEIIRVAAGFTEEWSPYYDRKQRSGVSAALTWAERAGGINGTGDLQRFILEMASGLDTVIRKMDEAAQKLGIEKRKPGRPKRAA